MKERKWLYTGKGKKQTIHRETIIDVDYADDIALLANASARAKSFLNSLRQAAGGIGLHMTADKTEYMCFSKRGDISTLNDGSLKLVATFIDIENSISSTENEINKGVAKTYKAIDRLSVMWKSDLSDKIKRDFFQATAMSILLYGYTTWRLTKRI